MSNTHKKGDGEPKAAGHETQNLNPNTPTSSIDLPSTELAGNVNSNLNTPTVESVVDGIEYAEVKTQGEAIVKLDGLLVENEARGTIYYLALGLIAKQARAKLKQAHPKKKLDGLFNEFISGLKLSMARSPRTIQRYIQLVEKMTDDGTLSGTLADALRESKFNEKDKEDVLKITGGVGLTDLYVLYGMVSEKPPKVKVEKSIEDRLMDEIISLINTHKKLTKIRAELVVAGEVVDPSLDKIISTTSEALITLSKHPVIDAMLKKLEEEEKAKKVAKA